MQRPHRSALGAALLSLGLAACGGPKAVRPAAALPDSLRAPAGQLMTLKTHARGVQIYACRAAKEDVTRYEWTLLGPEATLTDQVGNKVARHYAGPTWEASDGSKVAGEVVARVESPRPRTIPWLLLKASTNSDRGRFAAVRSIQRLNTVGGAAPTSCTAAQLEQELRVNYSADYLFYVGAGA